MRRINFFLGEDKGEFLEKLPGTITEHIRRAIDEYIQKVKNQDARPSLSKRNE